MVRHVVMFRFQPGIPEGARKAMADGLAALPRKIPVIRQWSQGFNTVESDRHYDFCLVGDFQSVDDLQVYQDHPAHQDVVHRLIRPVTSSVVVTDFQLP